MSLKHNRVDVAYRPRRSVAVLSNGRRVYVSESEVSGGCEVRSRPFTYEILVIIRLSVEFTRKAVTYMRLSS